MFGFIRNTLGSFFSEVTPGEAIDQGALPPTVAKTKELLEYSRLDDLLPYQSYDDETGLFYNHDSYGFILEVSPGTSITEDRARIIAGALTNGIEADTKIQISLYGSPDVWPHLRAWGAGRVRDHETESNDGDKRNVNVYRKLARDRITHILAGTWKSLLAEQPALVRDLRLFFTLQRPLERGTTVSPLELDRMKRLRSAIKGSLRGAGFGSMEMNDQHFIDLMRGILNPQETKREPAVLQNQELREQMVMPSTMMLWGRDGLYLDTGEKRIDIRTFSVKEYPSMWAGWQNAELIGSSTDNELRMPCPFLVTVVIHYPDQMSSTSNAKMKSMRATQMSESEMGKHLRSWQEKRDEWQFVVNKLEEGHTTIEMTYQVVLFAPHGEGEHAEHQLISIYKKVGWRLVKNRFVALNTFLAALPFTAGPGMIEDLRSKKFLRTFLSWTAANVAPLIGEWKGTKSPLMLLFGRRGQIMYFDPWDNTAGNYNVACAAASGAGKSVFFAEFTVNVLGTGGKMFAFDRGRSFENLCKILGGTHIAFAGGQSKISLNPFTFIQHWEGSEEVGAERIMLKSLIGVMADTKNPLRPEQMSWIEEALETAWRAKGTTAEITDVYEELAKQEDQRKRDLADAIRPYTRNGFYGSYFAGPSNIDLNNDYVVLEMKELDSMPDLQSVVLLILMMRIGQSLYIGDRNQRKGILVDEAWKLMSGNAGEFVEELARTARKHSGALITVTQGINDYYKSSTALAAFENSDTVVLLRQKESSVKQLVQSGRLPSGEGTEQLLLTVKTVHGQYSEAAIVTPDGISIERLYLHKFAEKLYSTKGEEYQFIQNRMAAGDSIYDAVGMLVEKENRGEELVQ